MQFANVRRWNGLTFEDTAFTVRRGRLDFETPLRAAACDMAGALLLPALVNAHDHLELNHYPRTKFRERYTNASQWAQDMTLRLDLPPLAPLRAHPLHDRLRIGIIRNLLAGALTVFQHGPLRRDLFSARLPIQLVRRYGWAHSLYLSPAAAIQQAHRRTPTSSRFFIHLAEGTDLQAQAEYDQLAALGCVDARTVLVHGVGMSPAQIADARQRGATLVTCPTTNQYLLGRTADAPAWGADVVLGSDSRLTADGDLLDEIRAAMALWGEATVWEMLHTAAQRLGLSDTTRVQHQAPASFILLDGPPARQHIRLVVRRGVALWGDEQLMKRFSARNTVLCLDGQPRAFQSVLARWMQRGTLTESGVTVPSSLTRHWR